MGIDLSVVIRVLSLAGIACLAAGAFVLLLRVRIRSWQDAEQAVARWLVGQGCSTVKLTAGGADGGLDVITRTLAVQVKHTDKRIGRPTVQQTLGAAVAIRRQPALFSTSGYTDPAMSFADENDVALFVLELSGSARPLNRIARRALRERRR